MWTDLVRAYESKLAVLEEARAAYSNAVAEVVGHAGPAMEAAVREAIGDVSAQYRVEAAILQSGDSASFALAPWFCITIVDDVAGTEFRVGAWIASSWGGPEGVLCVGLSLEKVRSTLDLKEWVAKCGDSIADMVLGEPVDRLDWQKLPGTSTDRTIRIASFDLVNRDFRQTAQDAHDAARGFAESVVPMIELIRDAGLAMSLAEDALLRYRPSLKARAAQAGQLVSPAKDLGSLGRGGKYLQVGSFWLATNPVADDLLAAAYSKDEEIIEILGKQLSRPTGHRGGGVAVVLLDEKQLRDPDIDIDLAIAKAFDAWFDAKARELSASSEGEPA